jgi:hypothetical protein
MPKPKNAIKLSKKLRMCKINLFDSFVKKLKNIECEECLDSRLRGNDKKHALKNVIPRLDRGIQCFQYLLDPPVKPEDDRP